MIEKNELPTFWRRLIRESFGRKRFEQNIFFYISRLELRIGKNEANIFVVNFFSGEIEKYVSFCEK